MCDDFLQQAKRIIGYIVINEFFASYFYFNDFSH